MGKEKLNFQLFRTEIAHEVIITVFLLVLSMRLIYVLCHVLSLFHHVQF